jgi:hypothetical protein
MRTVHLTDDQPTNLIECAEQANHDGANGFERARDSEEAVVQATANQRVPHIVASLRVEIADPP